MPSLACTSTLSSCSLPTESSDPTCLSLTRISRLVLRGAVRSNLPSEHVTHVAYSGSCRGRICRIPCTCRATLRNKPKPTDRNRARAAAAQTERAQRPLAHLKGHCEQRTDQPTSTRPPPASQTRTRTAAIALRIQWLTLVHSRNLAAIFPKSHGATRGNAQLQPAHRELSKKLSHDGVTDNRFAFSRWAIWRPPLT